MFARASPMIGAVLRQEVLLGGRRGRMHAFRWAYAGWLVLQVLFFFLLAAWGTPRRTMATPEPEGGAPVPSLPHVVGGRCAAVFLWQQSLLVLLVTPALACGAVTEEKQSGTLVYLLTSGLDAREILVGKLLGRVARVALLGLTGLPLLALLGGLGGVGPAPLLLAGLALLPPLFGLACVSLLASVWGRQTRDAVLGVYLAGGLAWLALRLAGLERFFDPLYPVEPAWGRRGGAGLREGLGRLLVLLACWGAVGVAAFGLAAARLRAAFLRQLEGAGPPAARWYSVERAPVGDDPVRWRERHVEGLAPVPALRRVPLWLGVTLVAALTAASSLAILARALPPGKGVADLGRALARGDLTRLNALMPQAERGFLVQSVVVLAAAGLAVGVRCSGAITGERERLTWESLLLTPMSAKQIVEGKFWGVMTASYWYLLAYAAPALTLSVLGGVLAFVWVLLYLGVTVVAMYFLGAAGLWCSARCRDSWRSLAATVGVGYFGGAAAFAAAFPAVAVAALLLQLVLRLLDAGLGTATSEVTVFGLSPYWTLCLVAAAGGLAAVFGLLARLLLRWAHKHVADRERARHWEEEPRHRRLAAQKATELDLSRWDWRRGPSWPDRSPRREG
jgi:ABC-type transport system involved in multi-copper enzyme maturation permease subunit